MEKEYKPELKSILSGDEEELKETEKTSFLGCSKCDAGYINGNICDCLKKEILSRKYINANIDEDYASQPIFADEVTAYLKDDDSDGGKFEIDLESFIDEYVTKSADNIKNGKGVIFNGPVGRGKSLSAMKILMKLIGKGYNGYFITIKNYFDIVKKSWNDEDFVKLKNHIYDCDFLVIDDLGTEYQKQDSDWVPTEIDGLMRHRYYKKKPLIVTTNASLENLKAKYAQRVISLFSERSFIVPIVSESDHRQKMAKIPDYIETNKFKKKV